MNYTRFAIPIIAALIVGGLVSFFIVYSFYPEKHENIKIDGKCYELTGAAHHAFINLTSRIEKNSLLLQLNKVEDINATIPITFTGEHSAIKNFININHIMVTSIENVTLYPNIVGNIINGNISIMSLSSIVEGLSLDDLSAASISIQGSISIMANEHITNQEMKDISILKNKLLQNGIKNIVATHNGVKPAECRYR
jgi:hypothetical protein